VDSLRERFLERSAADLILIYAYPEDVSREELGFVAHRLAGAAAVFGYEEVHGAAAELEAALGERLPDETLPTRPLARALTQMLAS
jgi:HPt (histidine-containing phosphotransfer) domain-containing protein